MRTTPAAGRRAADIAIAGHEARSRRYLHAARIAMVGLLVEFGAATTDDLRARLPVPNGVDATVLGAVPRALVRAGVIRHVGWRESVRESAHARPIRVWRLSVGLNSRGRDRSRRPTK